MRARSLEFEADAPELWPAVAQTNLVFEIFGAGRYGVVEELQPDGTVRTRTTKYARFSTMFRCMGFAR